MVEWIRVNNELPPKDCAHVPVLIWGGYCYVGYFREYYNIWIDLHGKSIENVTHWSAFPRGPNGEVLAPKVFIKEDNNA